MKQCWNANDFRGAARRRLPSAVFDYIAGGADDEVSVRENCAAFQRYALVPRLGESSEPPDITTTVLGQKLSLPILLSPVGCTRLVHHQHDLASARAAAGSGTMFMLSTVGSASIEDVATIGGPSKVFQIYLQKNRENTARVIDRCKDAGIGALCLTIDAPVAGNRERDKKNGFRVPFNMISRQVLKLLIRPSWCLDYLRGERLTYPNVSETIPGRPAAQASISKFIETQFVQHLTWDDVAWLADRWKGPLAVKGILSANDAARAVAAGATAIIVSNHGGRQLDGVMAPIDCVRAIRNRVGPTVDIILDGGVRRGSDVMKARALGANACSFGRPYVYALATGGERGVARLLSIIEQELRRNMTLIGCDRYDDLDSEYISHTFP